MKKEVFLERALQVHGDKYDYSMVPDECDASGNVPVGCKEHGLFFVKTSSHICSARGCSKCAKAKTALGRNTKARDVFIEKAEAIHNYCYDYSETVYVRANQKVKIRCLKHNHIFEVAPNSHLSSKHGCPLCARENTVLGSRKPLKYFIDKANSIHNFRYDYSLVPEGVHSRDEVNISCPKHGIFSQTMSRHANGARCPKCARENKNIKRKTTEEFILEAIAVHGDRYDYSVTEFSHRRNANFLCKKHGLFSQRPDHHLTTDGCQKCSMEAKSAHFSMGKDVFVNRANHLHKGRYDYSKVDYVNSTTKVTITCSVHGDFEQVPSSHLEGSGCPRCATGLLGYKSYEKGYLYIIKVTDNIYKFGITNNLNKRFEYLNKKSVYDLELVYNVSSDDGYIIRSTESEIIASGIERGVLTKSEMQSGFTETFYVKDLDKVFSIIHKYFKPE